MSRFGLSCFCSCYRILCFIFRILVSVSPVFIGNGCVQVPGCHAMINALESTGLEGQPSVAAMLEEAAAMQQQQELFEMHVSNYLPLTRCQASST